jgi:sodium/proline symporter
VASSSITGDIYREINKKASDKHLVWFSRGSVFTVAVIALLFSWHPGAGVMALVANAWAGFGAAFGPLVLLSLYWRRVNRFGAVMGIIMGGGTVIVWEYIPMMSAADGLVTLAVGTQLYSLVPGFFLSAIAIIAGSLLTKTPSEKILKDFETASRPLAGD